MSPDLADRQRRILARLVAAYIEQGEPVSSSWLAEHSSLGLSPATVRNILVNLDEQGLISQPHTSAGRVPTDIGYRSYVDWLLESRRRPRPPKNVEAKLRRSTTASDVFENASQVLSHTSHQVAFVLASVGTSVELRQIDFVAIDEQRVLVIVVAMSGEVTHKMVECDEPYDAAALSTAANYVNRECAGMTIEEALAAIIERLAEERTLYDALLGRALRLARMGLSEVTPTETLHVQGTSFLVDEALGTSTDRDRTLETLRVLFRMIEEKHQLVELLTQYIETHGLTVVIGSEHASPEFHPFSVVASSFHDGRRAGTVGVIGPRRMRYGRAIAAVDGMSRMMTRVLEGQ